MRFVYGADHAARTVARRLSGRGRPARGRGRGGAAVSGPMTGERAWPQARTSRRCGQCGMRTSGQHWRRAPDRRASRAAGLGERSLRAVRAPWTRPARPAAGEPLARCRRRRGMPLADLRRGRPAAGIGLAARLVHRLAGRRATRPRCSCVLSAIGLHRLRICLRVWRSGRAGSLAAAALPGLLLLPWTGGAAAGCSAGAGHRRAAARRPGGRLRGAARGPPARPADRAGRAGRGRARPAHSSPGCSASTPSWGCGRGFLDHPPRQHRFALPVLGGLSDLGALVVAAGSAGSSCADPSGADADLAGALRACRQLRRRRLRAAPAARAGHGRARGLPGRDVGHPADPAAPGAPGAGPGRRLAKRALRRRGRRRGAGGDRAAAGRRRSWSGCGCAGPVLFRQVRVVGGGRQAEIVKLRTLGQHGDPDTSWECPTSQCGALGRFLRITHLDELPQLVSVLRGRHVPGRAAPGAAALRPRSSASDDPRLRRPAADAGRDDRVGPGAPAERRHLDH